MSTIIFITILLLLVAPIVEIVVKRPGILFELSRVRDLRAFAEPQLSKESTPREVANDCGQADAQSDKKRLAA